MGRSNKQQVPECRYGAACTRKDCIFRHPPKPKAAAKSAAAKPGAKSAAAPAPAPKSDKVCFAFVAGKCLFGRGCRDLHPDQETCITIAARYQNIDCQWGRGCRTDGCLYRHPNDEVVGPALVEEPAKRQPAVFAAGPTISSQSPGGSVDKGHTAHIVIPEAISQAADLRDASAFEIPDSLERFMAVNARNTGSQSAALLDLHFQTVLTFASVLDLVLPERVHMFPSGVWIVTGATIAAPQRPPTRSAVDLFDAVREYLVRRRYEFAIGADESGHRGSAFLVRRRKREDPLEGVRAILLCGLPGSGKTTFAKSLLEKSGRFVRIAQEEMNGDRAATEAAFRQAVKDASDSYMAVRKKAGCLWWDRAFSAAQYYLGIPMRGSALAYLVQWGVTVPSETFFKATVSFQPNSLDLRRFLGRPFRVSFRSLLVLEAKDAPAGSGETIEAILCSATDASSTSSSFRPVPLYIPLKAPRAAIGRLQLLNAVPLDKRILANQTIGSFKVREVVDLQGSAERLGLCVLMHKAGDARDTPALVSFDAAAVISATSDDDAGGCGTAWTEVGDAALSSLDPLVVFEDVGGDSDLEWFNLARERCEHLGMEAPTVEISRPVGRAETKLEQWGRLKPSSLLHCSADEADVAQFLKEGTAALRRGGGAALPPYPSQEVRERPRRVVVLDRCNATVQDRGHWMRMAGLQSSEVVAMHFDVPEAECIQRVFQRGSKHPTMKASSEAEASRAVRPFVGKFEAPAERESFKAMHKLKGQGAAATLQELLKLWAGVREEPPAGRPASGEVAKESDVGWWGEDRDPDDIAADEELAPPPLATLQDWIEAGASRSSVGTRTLAWGAELGGAANDATVMGGSASSRCPPPAEDPPPPPVASTSMPRHPLPVCNDCGLASDAGAVDVDDGQWYCQRCWEELTNGASSGSGCRTDNQGPQSAANRRTTGMGTLPLEADAEELDRLEQLAATLRCMGFDEEPSYQAAQSAGGNLNLAVEAVLRSNDSVG